jgi:hypothetical protein
VGATELDVNNNGVVDSTETSQVADFSGHGARRIRIDGSYAPALAVDMVASGEVLNYHVPNGPYLWDAIDSWYYYPTGEGPFPGGLEGTSFAAPQVSGQVALLQQGFYDAGLQPGPRELIVNMLLMGDGMSDARTIYAPWWNSGVGHSRIRAPQSMVGGPWGWGYRSLILYEGQTVTWTVNDSGPEAAPVREWKWAVTWFDPLAADASDIVIQAIDTCANNAVLAQDLSASPRKRIILRDWAVTGKCVVMKVTALHTSSSGIRLYSADLYHSGSDLPGQ